MRILIKNGTIVNANGRERKDILTDGDRIIAMGGNLDAAGAEVIDAAGCYVMPGFIDTHTHFDLDVGLCVTPACWTSQLRTGTGRSGRHLRHGTKRPRAAAAITASIWP